MAITTHKFNIEASDGSVRAAVERKPIVQKPGPTGRLQLRSGQPTYALENGPILESDDGKVFRLPRTGETFRRIS